MTTWDATRALELADSLCLDDMVNMRGELLENAAYYRRVAVADMLRAAVAEVARLGAAVNHCLKEAGEQARHRGHAEGRLIMVQDERDHLADENEKLRDESEDRRILLDMFLSELSRARAVVDIARKYYHRGWRDTDTMLCDAVGAYDAHLAAKGET